MLRDCKRMGLGRAIDGIVFLCVSFMLLPGQFAFGQVDEGSITGTVTDSTGAVVPGRAGDAAEYGSGHRFANAHRCYRRVYIFPGSYWTLHNFGNCEGL